MECKPLRFSFEELELITDNFSEENLIGIFQYGKFYRGYFDGREVIVKKWEDLEIYHMYYGDNEKRFKVEIKLLLHSKMRYHPTMVELIGYCNEGEERLGAVLDLKPLDSLYNIVLKDSFSWLQRMKVIIGFAFLLEFMHEKEEGRLPYLLRNTDAHHIMLDEDYNPKLVDFGMVSGGICPDKRKKLRYGHIGGCFGYIDPFLAPFGKWCEQVDVFAFGILLVMLISKRNYREEDIGSMAYLVSEWIDFVYKPQQKKLVTRGGFVMRSKYSLVHKSLSMQAGYHPSDGLELTKLALRCIEYHQLDRPTMKQVLKVLLNLRVVHYYPDILGIPRFFPTTTTTASPQQDNGD